MARTQRNGPAAIAYDPADRRARSERRSRVVIAFARGFATYFVAAVAMVGVLMVSTRSAFAQAPLVGDGPAAAKTDGASAIQDERLEDGSLDRNLADPDARKQRLTELVRLLDSESAHDRANALAELSEIVTEDDWPVLEPLYRNANEGSQEILLARVLQRSGWIAFHDRDRVAHYAMTMRSKDPIKRRDALWSLLSVPNGERVLKAELARAPGELALSIDRVPFSVLQGDDLAFTVRLRNTSDHGFWVWLAPLWGRLTMQASYTPLGPYAFANVSRRHGASARAHHWAAREVNEIVEFQWLEPGAEIVSPQLYTNSHRLGRVELAAVYDCVRTRIHVERSRSSRLPFSSDYTVNAWRGAITAETVFYSVSASAREWERDALRGMRLAVSGVDVVTFEQVQNLTRRLSVPGLDLGGPSEDEAESATTVPAGSKTVYRNGADHRDVDDRERSGLELLVAGDGDARAIGIIATLTAQNAGNARVTIRNLQQSARETVLAIVRDADGHVLAIAPALALDVDPAARQSSSQTLGAGERASVDLLVPVQLAAGTYRVQFVMLDVFREAARNPVDAVTATVTVHVE